MGNIVDLRTRRVKMHEIRHLADQIIRECAEEGIIVDYDTKRRIREYMFEALAANPIMRLPE